MLFDRNLQFKDQYNIFCQTELLHPNISSFPFLYDWKMGNQNNKESLQVILPEKDLDYLVEKTGEKKETIQV